MNNQQDVKKLALLYDGVGRRFLKKILRLADPKKRTMRKAFKAMD